MMNICVLVLNDLHFNFFVSVLFLDLDALMLCFLAEGYHNSVVCKADYDLMSVGIQRQSSAAV